MRHLSRLLSVLLLACPTSLVSFAQIPMQESVLTAEEQAMIDWIDANEGNAIALLKQTVNIGSGTMNHAGVRAVGDTMADAMAGLGLRTQWIDMPAEIDRAGHLFATKEGADRKSVV